MRAMILAAGLGTRMRPLTEHTPKPLLRAGGAALIEYHIRNLVAAGFKELVINHAWLGDKLESYVGDGSRYGAHIVFSREAEPLETAGGIKKALPLLCAENIGGGKYNSRFLVVNGDIWTDYPFSALKTLSLEEEKLMGYLVMVNNPLHNESGDFRFTHSGHLRPANALSQTAETYTYSGLGIFHQELFADVPTGVFPLAPVLRNAMKRDQIGGEVYTGTWFDIGTPERLRELDQFLHNKK